VTNGDYFPDAATIERYNSVQVFDEHFEVLWNNKISIKVGNLYDIPRIFLHPKLGGGMEYSGGISPEYSKIYPRNIQI
jgi:hypothetical protein